LERYEDIKSRVLYSDDAVSGEAAGVALGLVMLGSANQTAIEEMLTYAHQTEHEKIIRGIAIGLGLIMSAKIFVFLFCHCSQGERKGMVVRKMLTLWWTS
jgi:hypothetical protein